MKRSTKISALLIAFFILFTSLLSCDFTLPSKGTETDYGGPQTSTEPYTTPKTEPSHDIEFSTDPYIDISKKEFYANYSPASCYLDAYYRTQHFLMSGSLDAQDQKPTIASNQPKEGKLLIRNTSALYEDDGNTYIVLDANGNEAFRVYKGGGYVTLEEVAAYIYAFGEIPANYISKKIGKPASNPWGVYLRVNHSAFFGSTTKYPYEPELPNISGCGGGLSYYELDIGTTGTDCDPSYRPSVYNNGSTITRGAARLVYTRHDINNNKIIDPNERFVFYTYNHYNDFQEYLNYEGGWGEIFGNVTGGGTISSKTDYNPTPYIPVARRNFATENHTLSAVCANILTIDFLLFKSKGNRIAVAFCQLFNCNSSE